MGRRGCFKGVGRDMSIISGNAEKSFRGGVGTLDWRFLDLALRLAAEALILKRDMSKRKLRHAVHAHLHIKQVGEVERELESVVAPVFVRGIKSMARRLQAMDGKSTKGYAEEAESLVAQIFDPKEWHVMLVDAVLPVLAAKMAEAMVAYFLSLGVDIRRSKSVKATTATEWMEDHPEDLDMLEDAMRSSDVSMGVWTELPERMKRQISTQLTESFEQPYWKTIHETTGGDAERFLRQGLEEGHSIRRMATAMSNSFAGDTGKYALRRATNIARTESGNALNGARDASIADLKAELGDAGETIRKSWISVLGNTTRADHANLDGVPADAEGMFNLGGYMIPWPGHYSLPAGQRCNCMCTLGTEFGMQEGDANQLIDEYRERIEQ